MGALSMHRATPFHANLMTYPEKCIEKKIVANFVLVGKTIAWHSPASSEFAYSHMMSKEEYQITYQSKIDIVNQSIIRYCRLVVWELAEFFMRIVRYSATRYIISHDNIHEIKLCVIQHSTTLYLTFVRT